MAPDASQLLFMDLPYCAVVRLDGSSPSLSRKDWTREFSNVAANCLPPTNDSIDNQLGLEEDDPTETYRLSQVFYDLNELEEIIQNEADVERDFNRNLSSICRLVWSRFIKTWDRSQTGPLGHTQDSKTIDYFLSWPVLLQGGEICLCAGELKSPGIIITNEWLRYESMTSISKRLGQEMRG